MAANNPWEMSWKEDTTATTSEQGSSPWTMNWQEEKAKPTKKLSAIEQIRTGNFPAAERFRAGYAQMPEYLQDPYLGLSTSNIGKVGAEMFPGVTKFISQTTLLGLRCFIITLKTIYVHLIFCFVNLLISYHQLYNI